MSSSSTSSSSSCNKSANSQWELNSNYLPNDIALNIASFLEVSDLCSLGSCSRFWRDLCASDCLWMDLCRNRWPSLGVDLMVKAHGGGESSADTKLFSSPSQGWKSFYISWHKEMAGRASTVINFVEQCSRNDSLEVGDYLKAVGDLCSMDLGFKDVKLFLFTAKHSVFLNLIGLHYSIFGLGIPANDVKVALNRCQVSDRLVCVNWFKLGRWFYGFRLPDESRSRRVSLSELTMPKEEEVRNVLNRGLVHEVLRVQITPVATS